MKSVLISINPKWCELIANGKKTVEVKKTRPKVNTPFKVYIYCTENGGVLQKVNNLVQKVNDTTIDLNEDSIIYDLNGKVIGEFVCDEIYDIGYSPYNHGGFISNIDNLYEKSCLDLEQMFNYLSQGYGYGWHISNLVIYDKPKWLSDFKVRVTNKIWSFTKKLKSTPRSWRYVESEVSDDE